VTRALVGGDADAKHVVAQTFMQTLVSLLPGRRSHDVRTRS
jgi:hypothetical protein